MPVISTYSLAPYNGTWGKDEQYHLLRRTLFGIGHKDVTFFKHKTLPQTLDILLKQSPAPPRLTWQDPDVKDPLVPTGSEWINAPYENDAIDTKRTEALRSWWISRIVSRDYSITEKMILFWHNHFPVEMNIVKDARYGYRYYTMLRSHALANYKSLIKEGTTNLAMLVYLNGNSNNKTAPNENYARELMELFTLGKTSDVKYTEDDVKAAARVLTGWKDNKETISPEFHPDLHDTGNKQFSAFFDNRVINGRAGADGANEVADLVDMIFGKEATAKFFCRNLYRWFVCAHVDELTEHNIITPLAQTLVASNFEIAPVLTKLLGSEHFFDKVFRGCIEKSPMDFLVGAIQQFAVDYPTPLSEDLLCSFIIHDFMSGLAMNVLNPPSVAGWPAYYQAPKYHQLWINPSSLSVRVGLVDDMNSAKGLKCNGPVINIDVVNFTNKFESPEDINALIDESTTLMFAVKISDRAKSKLKGILLSGEQAEHYWEDAWKKYRATPNEENKSVVENRLRSFYKEMTNMVQYQMS